MNLFNHKFSKAIVRIIAQCDLLSSVDCVKTYTVFDTQSLSNITNGLLSCGYRFDGCRYIKETSFYNYIAYVTYEC